jgi:hypothetical protein
MCSETNPEIYVLRMAALSRQEPDIDLMSQRDVTENTEKTDLFVRSLSPNRGQQTRTIQRQTIETRNRLT